MIPPLISFSLSSYIFSLLLLFFHFPPSLCDRVVEKTEGKEEREREMKKAIRCCISCIFPCGALDVIRIVHSNGRVEEISGRIRACEIMKANPKHVLKKPSSPNYDDDHVVPKIVIVPPDAELKRGKIYFLMPMPSLPEKTRKPIKSSRKKKRSSSETEINNNNNNAISMTNLLISDQYLSEILSEKLSSHRERRRGRVGVWRPHLESICESPSDL